MFTPVGTPGGEIGDYGPLFSRMLVLIRVGI